MNVIVKGQHIDVGDALRQHVSESLGHVFGKYFGDAIDVTVTFSRQAHLLRASVSAHVGRGIVAQSHASADQPYAAFDLAAERLGTRLRRHKRRLRDHHKTPLETRPAEHYVLAADLEAEDGGATEAADGGPPVIAEMKTEIPVLTVSEAVMRLDLEDSGALMFVNRGHGGLNMVYRRPDGNVGWVDPRGNTSA